jgi:hypothetical protein
MNSLYCNEYETPEEEWNFHFNNKRVSIEALEAIELKKKGDGPIKKLYNSENFTCGPCYDPGEIHVHIWKKDSLIKNFIGEQRQNVLHVQFTEYKKGTYCSICHQSCQKFNMKWRNEPDEEYNDLQVKDKYTYKDIIPFLNKNERIEKELQFSISKKRWKSILFKVKYIIKNNKTVYPISEHKSLLLWPWEMTPYQKFKLSKSNYKKKGIFINSKIQEFKDSYACIK